MHIYIKCTRVELVGVVMILRISLSKQVKYAEQISFSSKSAKICPIITEWETYWSQIRVTGKMIQTIKIRGY